MSASTITSEKAIDMADMKRHTVATVTLLSVLFTSMVILRNWDIAAIKRYDFLFDPAIAMLSEMSPYTILMTQGSPIIA